MMSDEEIAAEQALIREQQTDVKVSHLLHPSNYLDKDARDARLEVCRGCDRFLLSMTCKECGCFMAAKTWLTKATCPLGKW